MPNSEQYEQALHQMDESEKADRDRQKGSTRYRARTVSTDTWLNILFCIEPTPNWLRPEDLDAVHRTRDLLKRCLF